MRTIEIPELRLFVGSGKWSGVYADGELVQCGDHYLCDEKIRGYAGVTVISDDAFLRGGDGVRPHGPAETLAEVDEFILQRENRLRTARQKRAEAAKLLAEAEALESTFR
jgi:hypothetical protein